MSKSKVFIVNPSTDYVRMFDRRGWSVVDKLYEADLVQFTGGEDVHPMLYDEPLHHMTRSNLRRDRGEVVVFNMANDFGLPLAGICRGGQFLNVMCGGKMYQHVSGHATGATHVAQDETTGDLFEVTSTHHQMMIPGEDGRRIVTADVSVSRHRMSFDGGVQYEGGGGNGNWDDTEAVWYPKVMAFCFQPHPEFPGHEELADRYFSYLNKFIFGE